MAYGALAGTEAGPIGWIAGAGVGLIIYYIADETIGEGIEESVREAMDEQGCVAGGARAAAQPQPAPPPEPKFRYCFTGRTRVAMADGSDRPISEVHIGDAVLAFDETTSNVSIAHVTRVFVHEPGLWMAIHLDDESTLEVTPEHPPHVGGSWTLARATSGRARASLSSDRTADLLPLARYCASPMLRRPSRCGRSRSNRSTPSSRTSCSRTTR